jgi:hypothetical protein
MFSKLIPRKLAAFEVQVTDNPRWQASISLYPEPDTGVTEIEKYKVNYLEILR